MPKSLKPKKTAGGWLVVAFIAGLGGLLFVTVTQRPASAQKPAAAEKPYTTWKAANGTPDSSNYSALTQINRSNVTSLQVAWTYDSGDKNSYTFQPLVVDRTMYGLAHNGNLVAVDAASGKEIWVHSFSPTAEAPPPPGGRGGGGISSYRGLNYWESKDRSDQRVLVRAGAYLQAIDGKTGKLVETFGDKGRVDLHTGMTRNGLDNSKSPGQIFEDLIILGAATGEAYGSPPADIRAFDVVTGKLAWVFHTIPHPGEPGYETWPKDAWTYSGGAGDWGDFSIDDKRGIAYIPTGTPKYEFWGGDRHGDALYGDSILALDARTGKLIWHYQMIHHDIWEYEFITAPQLLTVHVNGRPVDVVSVVGKNGFMYVFDRVTGKPVWPIEERKVPPSDVPGEILSPTQPFPTKPPPFERQSYTLKDIDTQILTEAERTRWTDLVKNARNEGLYTPLGTEYFTIMMPGNSGGANLFSTSADPATGTSYVISFAQPSLERLYTTAAEASRNIGMGLYGPAITGGDPLDLQQVTRRSADAAGGRAGGRGGSGGGGGGRGTVSADIYPPGVDVPRPMYTAYGMSPAMVTPPYSHITAYDLNTGTIRWQIPYGEAIGVDPPENDFGIIKVHGPKARLGITAGGLAFSATIERKVRAFDKDTGKVLWTTSIPDGAEGAPAIYEVDGREYVVFCIRGAYIAYALPSGSK